MAISMAKKKSKKSKNVEVEDRGFLDLFIYRALRRIPAAFLLLMVLFLWSSSTTLISGSIVHVCVSSRKLNNLYCLSAGAQPGNYSIPIPFVNNSSKFSVDTLRNPVSSFRTSSEPPVRNSQNSTGAASVNPNVISSLKSSSEPSSIKTTSESAVRNSAVEEKTKEVVSVTKKSPAYEASPTPASVVRDSIDIQEIVSSKDQVSGGLGSDFSPFTKPVIRKGIDKAKAVEIANARKDVEGQLAVLRSYIAKSTPSSCQGRGIYVYDLPSKFNKDLLALCKQMLTWLDFCKFLTNNGIGEPIPELGKDWFNTHQYALEPVFHSHILKHRCRVHNEEDAKLFYVPFYGGLDVLRWHFTNVSNEVKDSLSKELVQWLKLQKPWKRNFGMDHVFVLGKISWDFRRWEKASWGSRLLEFDELQNPMKLLIERHAWQINDVGVPHPTYFHPSSDEDIISWQTKIRQVYRKHLISFAGATRNASESIRSILINQCTSANSENTCKFFDCKMQACVKPAPVVRLFTESEFCLQPPGDSATRKSVFDSLVAGCIPVVFDPFTAHYQYPWHLPEDYRKYSVYIDQDEVKMKEVNVVERLMKIPLKERQEMRRYIIDELMPRLVYPHPNGKLNKFQDAFSIAVNNLIERACRRLRDVD
ncbi:hypothetical protein Cgig2_026126 [Carnegiea gigantea]|uniref:Exostosin GT47 domain-containing protein n=1 Tax=Carnegiea gigantea TaxID=171969 RepID=A0A9Q1GV03_9CARY|nr:hypothetical protein Cgig2_026126 [Carnegiea gigantea]